jgi:deoxyribodipyrimidine photolyase-related protein
MDAGQTASGRERKVRSMLRTLVVVLGDQLDDASAAFDGFDDAQDAILQMEVRTEADYIPQHRLKIAYFFSAMRHFRDAQRARGRRLHYVALDDPENCGDFPAELRRQVKKLQPERTVVLEPGDWRVRASLEQSGVPIEFRADRHFLCPRETFEAFIAEHRRPVMETFYRFMRRRLDVLIDTGGEPLGGEWNFDKQNREKLGRHAPPVPAPLAFAPDEVSTQVVALVRRAFPNAPGRLDGFNLPVTRQHAQALLTEFVAQRLPQFGRYQDALRNGAPFLFHSRLSGPLNLHLISPQQVVSAVLENPAAAPLNAVEGYVRQVIGWREFVHGIYWHLMPGYAERNSLEATLPMPAFYWTGQTDLVCLADAIQHTLDHAYAHHIERLMVLGLFALLLGVRPYDVHRWHMSMFWDAVDWVSLPNTLGMGQHGDGGIMGTKPYVASGAYIDRMSDHCGRCRYDPRKAVGEDACPFTTLYWDFLVRHRRRLAANRRMGPMFSNLDRKDAHEVHMIQRQAETIRDQATAQTFLSP